MIYAQNIKEDNDGLFTIVFDYTVLKHLKCKVDDYLIVIQSNFNPNYFLIVKANSGYKVKRYPNKKKVYQVDVNYQFNYIDEFEFKSCIYFIKNNHSIRVKLPK